MIESISAHSCRRHFLNAERLAERAPSSWSCLTLSESNSAIPRMRASPLASIVTPWTTRLRRLDRLRIDNHGGWRRFPPGLLARVLNQKTYNLSQNPAVPQLIKSILHGRVRRKVLWHIAPGTSATREIKIAFKIVRAGVGLRPRRLGCGSTGSIRAYSSSDKSLV
jgi:hypothetical protein